MSQFGIGPYQKSFSRFFFKVCIDLYRLYRLVSYPIGMMNFKFVSINTKKSTLEKKNELFKKQKNKIDVSLIPYTLYLVSYLYFLIYPYV